MEPIPQDKPPETINYERQRKHPKGRRPALAVRIVFRVIASILTFLAAVSLVCGLVDERIEQVVAGALFAAFAFGFLKMCDEQPQEEVRPNRNSA